MTLLRFDLSSIPLNSSVVSAEVSLYLYGSDAGSQTRPAQLHRLLKAWTEEGATWNQRMAGQPWSGKGPQMEKDYVDGMADGKETGQKGVWITWSIKDLAQSWVSDPANNLGVILLDPNPWGIPADSGYVRSYASSEYGNGALRPKLTILYDPTKPPASPTPTPIKIT